MPLEFCASLDFFSLVRSWRAALPSAGSGACFRTASQTTSTNGCVNALASVVLGGGAWPAAPCRASAVPSKSTRCSRSCWIRSGTLTPQWIGARLVYLLLAQ